jgi:hypothetical protein
MSSEIGSAVYATVFYTAETIPPEQLYQDACCKCEHGRVPKVGCPLTSCKRRAIGMMSDTSITRVPLLIATDSKVGRGTMILASSDLEVTCIDTEMSGLKRCLQMNTRCGKADYQPDTGTLLPCCSSYIKAMQIITNLELTA